MIDILKKGIVSALNERYPGVSLPVFEIDIPTDKSRTDFVCNVTFALSKSLKKDPFLIASEVVDILNNEKTLINLASFSAARPGFINIKVSDSYLYASAGLAVKSADTFGKNSTLKGQKWVVEHTSPNPNKAMHIGHLRNNLVGMSISKLLEYNGATVVCDAVDNDRGIAIIKAMWGYLIYKHKDHIGDSDIHYWFTHQGEWFSPEELGIKADHFVGECYLLGAEDFKSKAESEKSMRDMLVKWESKDSEVWSLWNKVLGYAHDGIEKTLNRLGNRWDKVWHEHEHYSLGKDFIQKGLEKKNFVVIDGGAVLTQLSSYNIPDTVLLRSDGTSLYITQDIALTKLKKDYYNADKLLWVIGPEQSTAMKQLFAVCEQLGIGKITDFFHVPYGQVNVKDLDGNVKKMSSRDGGTILIDDLLDDVKKQVLASRPNYTDEEAEKVGVAAVKFMILKSGRMADACFDTEESVRLDGASGVYILYSYARMCSVLTKGEFMAHNDVKLSEWERNVLLNFSYFPLVVRDSLKDFSPQAIAEYLTLLCQDFNALYANEKIISDDNLETSKKLLITRVCTIAIKNALDILGIIPAERM